MSIVLNIHEPWHYSNWEPVVRHLRPGEARIWVTPWMHRGADLVTQQRAQARTLGWLEQQGIQGIAGDLPHDPDVLATLAIEERLVPPERSMQVRMLYAVISKKYTYSELNRLCDAVMVASEFGRSLMERHGVRAHVVGYPKLDDVFNGVLTREVARQRLGLDPDRKVVLYAPTFAGMSSVDRFAAAFDTLDDSIQLLVQLHPVSYVKELSRYGQLGERFGWIPEDLAGPLALVASDLVVTDYSGVTFEACAADIPIVLLDDPTVEPSEDVEVKYRDVGPRVDDPAGLKEAVEEEITRPERWAERRQHYRERFFGFPGQAGAQAAEALREFARENLARRREPALGAMARP